MTDSLIHLADNAGREQLVEIFGTKAFSTGTNGDLEKTCDKRVLLMINELERCFMADRLVPSYRNLIAMAVIEVSIVSVCVYFFSLILKNFGSRLTGQVEINVCRLIAG
jgi:hypothetical protein